MATPNEENTLLLVAAGVAVWLIYSGKLDTILGKPPNDGKGPATGRAPRPNAQTGGADKTAAAVGAVTCIAAGAATGMPALGVAASPLCGAAAIWIKDQLGIGSSKVGRASNGKDVFPNDMAECAKRGIYDVNGCGALWDGVKWPWQAFPHQGDSAVYPPANKPPTGRPPGFR